MKDRYIRATLALINDRHEVEAVLSGLKDTLSKHGHEALYGGVLRGVLRELKERSVTTTRVTVAKEGDVNALAHAISTHLATLGAPGEWETVIDNTLIGGVVVEHDSRRIDASYKRVLADLYQQITK